MINMTNEQISIHESPNFFIIIINDIPNSY